MVLPIAGIALTLGLTYYSLRTIVLFKSSVAPRAWVYVSLSGVFFSVGLSMFLTDALTGAGLSLLAAVSMTIGGVFLLLGLRKNFLFWSSQDHFT